MSEISDFENEKAYIINPQIHKKIFIFLDACHMEKLARNCLSSKRIICDARNEPIEWKYFEKLELLQRTVGQLVNKLNKRHIQWDKKKISVRLAAETLNESVAVAFEHLLSTGHEEFKNCEATIRYIRYMNNIFERCIWIRF